MFISPIMIILLLVVGLITGSFLNVVIYRLPRRESVVFPPSHCPSCNHRLGVFDLIPVLSYIWAGGRCRYCHEKISPRYPVVELLTGLVTVVWWLRYGADFGLNVNSPAIAHLTLTYGLIAIAYIDLEHKIIPDLLTLPLIAAGLLFRLWQGEIGDALIGGLAGGGVLALIALIYPPGMGYGDAKLLAAAGVFLGWIKTCLILMLGSLLGLIVTVPLILLRKMGRRQQFPFGPFLALGALLIIYWQY